MPRPVHRPDFAIADDRLPSPAVIVAEMDNAYGLDISAAHFDLTGAGNRVSNPRAPAANAAVRNYAGDARTPLLIFTLPDDSGVRFIYGEPAPGNAAR